MAAVTANVVLCRAPVADVRARSANAAASRVPLSPMPHPQVTRMSVLQGSASKTLGVRQHAGRAAARDTALRAITDAKAEAAEAEANPEPALESDMGVDYTKFRDHLKAGEWELADNEHRRLMTVLAGEDAEDREWVYFTEVQNMPVTDLKTIDALWQYYSDGKFGFSVQRKIWIGQKRQWPKFFKAIDWTTGENGNYRKWPEEFIWEKEAARGHMPLTSALRGTQLLEALLEHPAYAPPKKKDAAADMKEAANKLGEGLKNAAESLKAPSFKGLKGLKKPSWMK